MKHVMINILIMFSLLTSCSRITEKKTDTRGVSNIKVDSIVTPSLEKDRDSEIDLLRDSLILVPIAILDDKNANVYEKYGIEFSGNCYACDLARLTITTNRMIWANVCDENDTFVIDALSSSKEGSFTSLSTLERTYILSQIDNAPVYELIIEGKVLELNNKRVSKFFTTKGALPFFKEHDCGDFDG